MRVSRPSRIRARAAALAALACACGAPAGSRAPYDAREAALRDAPRAADATAVRATGPVAEYDVAWDPSAGELQVEARIARGAGPALIVDRGAGSFVRELQVEGPAPPPTRDGAAAPATREGRVFEVPACSAGCRLRYRFALREACEAIDDLDVASREGAVLEAPPSTWLLAPRDAPGGALVRFRVTAPEGERFVTGVFRSRVAEGAWDITLSDLATSPYSAFGPMRVREIAARGGSVELAVAQGALAVTDEQIAAWADRAARSIVAYLGRFPMPSALALILPARGRWVGGGRTLAGGGGSIVVRVGDRATPRALQRDWVLVHEMTHLAFPSVARESHWAEEGLATYVEPFARARAGVLSPEEAWRGLVEGLPKGLPRDGDQGLDRTPTWGRTYWGGALFWFLADVRIRERTHGQRGLPDALRAILAAGGTGAVRWDLTRALEVGDRAVGAPVLRELYDAMRAAPHPVDLDALFASLGVTLERGRLRLDDAAPRASLRRAITGAAAQAPPVEGDRRAPGP